MWDMEPISVRLGGIGFSALNIIFLSKLTELQINMDLSCPECGILVLKKNLNRHLLKHQDNKGEKCFLGDKDFKTKNSLNQHLKTDEKPIEIQCPYKCGIFHSKSALYKHIKVKHERISFNCPYCNKNFTKDDYCTKHIETCRTAITVTFQF